MMKRGRFERAHGGTIFLDEVGELPLAAQVRLLRVLQERQIERVGGTVSVPVNVRVIAATNRDLELMVQRGEFRDDLWYRLNVFPIRIPPLRERRADIPAFVYHFIGQKVREMNLHSQPVLAQGTIEKLQQYDWPGNVRELENLVERELIRIKTTHEPLRFEEIPGLPPRQKSSLSGHRQPASAELQDLNSVMRSHMIQALQSTHGKIQGSDGAAALLGVHPSTLRHRLRKLGIPFGRIADFADRS
jgi:transcriptional regulator with GAF, ATPase, and Fis domain